MTSGICLKEGLLEALGSSLKPESGFAITLKLKTAQKPCMIWSLGPKALEHVGPHIRASVQKAYIIWVLRALGVEIRQPFDACPDPCVNLAS